MKNYKKQLDLKQSKEERYIIKKAEEYQKKFNIENSGGGWNDTTDAFRHVWGSAYLSLKYGNTLSHIGTTKHELSEPFQPEEEKKMDEWNNSVGREIAKDIRKKYKNIDKNLQWSDIEDLLAKETLNKIQKNKVITSSSDKRIGASTLNRSINYSEDRLDYYTKRIYESMQKSSSKNTIDKDAPKITGKTLKNKLDTQYQKLKDYTNKIYMESEAINKRFTGNIPKDYKNPHLENDRIFTKEEIDKMPRSEYQKNEKAIRYQRKTIGIPTKSQAEKTASKKGSGMVHVSGYTTSDGRKVGDYFRSYPRE